MGLSTKTEEADRLESQETPDDYAARVQAFVRERAHLYDCRPVTKQEWDEACGDTPEELGFSA
jgi:antitoxin VapB